MSIDRNHIAPSGAARGSALAGVVLLVALVAAACGSGAGPTTTVGAPAEPRVDDESAGVEDVATGGVDAAWADGVASFLDYELQRREIVAMAGMVAGMRGGDRIDITQWELQCDFSTQASALLAERWPTAAAGAPASWASYRTDVESYWSTFATVCETFAADQAIFDSDPAFRDALWLAEEAHVLSCEAFLVDLEPLISSSTTIPFCRYPNGFPIPAETFEDLPAELEEAMFGAPPGEAMDEGAFGPEPRDDIDPTAGPTSELTRPEEWVLLAPGAHSFDWFDPPVSVVNTDPWITFSEPDFMQFARLDGPGELALLAPSGIADPSQLVSLEEWAGPDGPGIPTIPVPEDLSAWAAQMPLLATAEPATVGGFEATYWRFEFDPGADGNSAIVVAPESQLRPYGAFLGEEILHVWHVPHPDGPIFLIESEVAFVPEEERRAPMLFDAISF